MSPKAPDMKSPSRLFMCETSYIYELGRRDVSVFPSLESLHKEMGCFDCCGWVEVEIKVIPKKKTK